MHRQADRLRDLVSYVLYKLPLVPQQSQWSCLVLAWKLCPDTPLLQPHYVQGISEHPHWDPDKNTKLTLIFFQPDQQAGDISFITRPLGGNLVALF